MEHIISSQVMRRLDINDVLHDAQHGFRKRRSRETQLLLSAEDFLKTLDKNVQMHVILLDFSKAFDGVAHKDLLKKLEAIGVTGTTLGWIASFLTDREQTVVLEGIIRRQASHIRSAPGYCPWPASVSYILVRNPCVHGLN